MQVLEALVDETSEPWLRVIERDPCSYCGGKDHYREIVGADHIVARSRGGGNQWDNLTACCVRCNSSKSNRSLLGYLYYRGVGYGHEVPA